MLKVVKRDGSVVAFDIKKIQAAMLKAFQSLNKDTNADIIELLSLRVTSLFDSKIQNQKIQVEDIQDCVEQTLSVSGYAEVAKAYILYRKQRETVREIQSQTVAYQQAMEKYINGETEYGKDNLLSLYSVGGLMLSNSGAITKNYWLNCVYDQQISQAHQSGDIYIHDLDMLSGDSAAWSLKNLLLRGLQSENQRMYCRPAKHLMSACNQLVNFLGIMQNEWAGAQGIPSFDTYLAPFIKKDKMSLQEVERCMETFVYGVNMPSRWGSQLPFSTIQLDWDVPEDLKDEPAIVGGKKQDFTYGQCQEEMKMIQKAFLHTMCHGNDTGRTFSFPIPTITLKDSFDWNDEERNALLFEFTSKYGAPYFANQVACQFASPREKLSDFDRLYTKPCGYFGYGENCGSIGMVTINLPRLAYLAKDEDHFFQLLEQRMDLVASALDVKKQVLNRFLSANLYPYTKQWIQDFNSYFGTFGIIGMNETCINAPWLQQNLGAKEGQEFAQKVLETMRKRLLLYQKNYHMFFNLEATPAESAGIWFVEKDKQAFSDTIAFSKNYYTNSSNLPVDYTDDVFEALSIVQNLCPIYNGGSVFHVFLDKRINRWQDCRNLVSQIAHSFSVPYFTISPIYSICMKDGYLSGMKESCPFCESKVETWSRIAGYYQPIEDWNSAKKQEFMDRLNFTLE